MFPDVRGIAARAGGRPLHGRASDGRIGTTQKAWKEAASAAMDRYACGDDAAFSELYDLLAPHLTSFAMRRTRDEGAAEDLVQQTFLQMHCARRHFAPGAAVTPWAFAIARRLLIDDLRKRGRGPVWVEGDDARESAAPGASPAEVTARRRLTTRMSELLARVSETDRTAFELIKFDGLSLAEAAEVLGTTTNAVKLRAFRTAEVLRASMGDQAREELGEP
jgi:RNA polymerase sigma-70 factor, ECF subfamily